MDPRKCPANNSLYTLKLQGQTCWAGVGVSECVSRLFLHVWVSTSVVAFYVCYDQCCLMPCLHQLFKGLHMNVCNCVHNVCNMWLCAWLIRQVRGFSHGPLQCVCVSTPAAPSVRVCLPGEFSSLFFCLSVNHPMPFCLYDCFHPLHPPHLCSYHPLFLLPDQKEGLIGEGVMNSIQSFSMWKSTAWWWQWMKNQGSSEIYLILNDWTHPLGTLTGNLAISFNYTLSWIKFKLLLKVKF